MNPIQLQFFIMMLSKIQKVPKRQKVPKQFQKKMIRQFKRKHNNKQRKNRHIFTNKDMRM